MCAGTAAGIGVIYMTSEWKGKDLLQYIPVYNRKINFSPGKKKMYFGVGKNVADRIRDLGAWIWEPL
jgi:hypothetical protein